MRISRLVVLLAIIIAAGIAWRLRMAPVDETAANAPETPAVAQQPGTPTKSDSPASGSGPAGAGATPTADRERELRLARRVAEAEAELAAVDGPLHFWGRVIDQSAEPVAGATVAYEVSSYIVGGRGAMNHVDGEVRSDVSGGFEIGGTRGHALTITSLEKSGYTPMGFERRTYTFAQLPTQRGDLHRPDRQAPVVFKMARLEAAPALRPFAYRAEIPTDGTTHRTSTGNGVLEGPFELEFRRGDIADAKKMRYDWTLTLRLNGGVVGRSIDEYQFLAPELGYAQTLELVMKTANPDWRQSATVHFFARTATGKFGRFTIRVAGPLFADEPRARVEIEGAINPTGSRHLEPPQP